MKLILMRSLSGVGVFSRFDKLSSFYMYFKLFNGSKKIQIWVYTIKNKTVFSNKCMCVFVSPKFKQYQVSGREMKC